MAMLRVRDVAQRLGLSLSSAYQLIQSGDLASYSVGRRKAIRVSDDDLQRYLDSRRSSPAVTVTSTRCPPKSRLRHIRLS